MRFPKKRIASLIVILCLCFTTAVVQASSAEVDRLKNEKNEATQKVNDIKNKKEQTQNQANALEDYADGLSNQITTLNGQISNVAGKINSTEESINEAEADIELLESQQAEIQALLDTQTNAMKKRIQYMYECRSTNTIINLLESGSIIGFMQRLDYMAQIASYDRNAITEYEATCASLQQTNDQISAKHAELTAYQEDLESQKSQLGSLVSSTKNTLANTNEQLEDTKQALEKIEEELKEAQAYEARIQEQYVKAQMALAESMAGNSEYTGGSYDGYTEDEMLLLAATIQAEADNQGVDGRDAVGSVIMNRVFSSKFPNTIAGVIYSPNQFAPVASGRVALILAQGPHSWCKDSAIKVLNGYRRTDALFFCTYSYAQSLHNSQIAAGGAGFLDRTEGEVILAHYFYHYR